MFVRDTRVRAESLEDFFVFTRLQYLTKTSYHATST